MAIFRKSKPAASTEKPDARRSSHNSDDTLGPAGVVYDHTSTDIEAIRKNGDLEDGKIPFLTIRTFVMAILAAMGGFIFGYDTGQISGFLEMDVFLKQFGIPQPDGTYYFSNVRSGLIVALLSIGTLIGALLAAPISNKFGRKTCIPWWCLVFSLGVSKYFEKQ